MAARSRLSPLGLLCVASFFGSSACLDWSSARSKGDADAGALDASAGSAGRQDTGAIDDPDAGAPAVDGGDAPELPDGGDDPADTAPEAGTASDAEATVGPGACPASACNPTQPCAGTATRYTCAGQFADFPLPARTSGDALGVQRLTVDRSVIRDDVTGLMWQREGFPTSVVEADAHAYCDELMLGGHDDWRLPSVHEFITILAGETTPNVDTTVFLSWSGGDYHTATADSEHLDVHLMVRSYGASWTFTAAADLPGDVACVRTDSVLYTGVPSERFVRDGALVHDTRTRLWWERVTPIARSVVTQADAESYCASLTSNGRSFRLPRLAELMSFVVYGKPSLERLPSPFEAPDNIVYISRTRVVHIDETTLVMGLHNSGATETLDTLTERGAVRCVSPD